MSTEALRERFVDIILNIIDRAGEDMAYLLCAGEFGHDIELSDRDQAKLKKLHDGYIRQFRQLVRQAQIKASDEAIARRCSKIDISGILNRLSG